MDKSARKSNLELLRILCILFIISDHFTGQSGMVEADTVLHFFFYHMLTSLSRVACSIFIIISAWFSVERDFHFKKIAHVWLTVIMYTVPLTIYLLIIGVATKDNLVVALYPVESSPLWFAGYYIILVLLSPFLNFFISNAPKRLIECYILTMLIVQSLFVTLTATPGFFSHDIWALIFLYIFTAYIKLYLNPKKSSLTYFVVFFILWLILTVSRTYAALHGMGKACSYLEAYRSNLFTIPNITMAYCLFFTFYFLNVKNSKIINTMASTTLGIYCFHQVPIWYGYLWEHGFKCNYYNQVLHGKKRMLYTICSILLVWIIGTIIELVRAYISAVLIENRSFYKKGCNAIDSFVNGNDGKHVYLVPVTITLIASCYFICLKLIAILL